MSGKDLNHYMSLPYKIEIIPDEEGTTFTAVIPDLKGCMSFGGTVEEAYQMLIQAKELWIETALERDWPVPEPKPDEPKEYSGRFVDARNLLAESSLSEEKTPE